MKIAIGVFLSCLITHEVAAKSLVGGQLVRKGKKNVCSSKACSNIASEVKRYIDRTVDPCTDFYKFACGGFVKSEIIPKGEYKVTVPEIMVRRIKKNLKKIFEAKIKPNQPKRVALVRKFYKSCMNKTAIAKKGPGQIVKILRDLGGWPVLDGEEWDESQFEWKNAMHKMRRTRIPNDCFVNFAIDTDTSNATNRIIVLDAISTGLLDEHVLKTLANEEFKNYYDRVVRTAVLLGADEARARHELWDALLLKMQLANITFAVWKFANFIGPENRMTIAEWNNTYPSVPWKDYLRIFLPPTIRVTDDEVVVVKSPEYYTALESLMDRTPKRVQANYAFLTYISTILSYIDDNWLRQQFGYREVDVVKTSLPRWNYCYEQVAMYLPNLVDVLYVKKYFGKKSKKNVAQMVMNLRQQFKKTLKQAKWLDKRTRNGALKKVATMTSIIGYPDGFLNDKKLEKYYRNVDLKRDDYLGNCLRLSLFHFNILTNGLRKPVNKNIRKGGYLRPTTVNAQFMPRRNRLNFPAGYLQGPIFGNEKPHYMNYGGLGSIIGHEIMHGFDRQGVLFNEDGERIDWWNGKTKKEFYQRSNCTMEQYENYAVNYYSVKLNGTTALNENIADSEGLKLAYNAYKIWAKRNGEEKRLPGLEIYSPKQMFWINFARKSCFKSVVKWVERPSAMSSYASFEFRVNGPVSNMVEFVEDFECLKNSNLTKRLTPPKVIPDKRCSIW